MKLVLDTNVLVSALLTRGTPPDQPYRAWEAGGFDLLISSWQISELRRVLGYKKLRPYIQPMVADLLMENIDSLARLIEIGTARSEPPDPDDNWILATAVDGEADLLVTGDKNDLLNLGAVEGVGIVTAHDAVVRLQL